jgi:peptidoglycan/xylan/chitin deacetylase (PgdA/CDA1 family)
MIERLRVACAWIGLIAISFAFLAGPAHATCDAETAAFGVSRVVQIDATHGPIFGAMTNRTREPTFLSPMEVMLTFDDGPMPWITKSILDTLDKFCAKATFFSVGRMALAYPETVKDVVARGHTLGSHTYSHPFNMPRMKPEAAEAEIERGFAAVSTAAGITAAPFFRFTGLADSNRLLGYLQTRGVATFTVDVVSNDSYIGSADRLADRTLAEIAKTNGGIVLFHDIKASTAKALPTILRRLQASGYKIVHMTAKTAFAPMADAMQFVAPKLAKAPQPNQLMPFFGTVGPVAAAPQVTEVSPVARDRTEPPSKESANKSRRQYKRHVRQRQDRAEAGVHHTQNDGWVAEIKKHTTAATP